MKIHVRKKLVSNHIGFRKFDQNLVSFVLGGNVSEFYDLNLWIVPNSADEPKLPPEAFIVGEIEKATKIKLVATMRRSFREVANNPTYQTYIINYGTNAEMAMREKWITSK